MSADPFGTAALRAAVLDAWTRSPTRLREDANTEEDHATGYYRDRVVVELAQNAADAAARAGAPGTLLLRLVEDDDGATLVAASTGEPLDARGVVSLSSMRASAKTGAPAGDASAAGSPATATAAPSTVGRFGVGFAAVRGVSDDVTVRTAVGGVRFSVALTRAALERAAAGGAPTAAELAALVVARGDALPALRLPFPVGTETESDDAAPSGSRGPLLVGAGPDDPTATWSTWATVVELRLRDTAAVTEVRRQLDEVDDTLLLALPALGTVEVQHRGRPPVADTDTGTRTGAGDRVLADVGARWLVAHGSGTVPAALVADRPVEERGGLTWTITWAVPRDRARTGSAGRHGVVHAPTPTDEPLTVPALLVASFPLDPSRRHVADVPLAAFVAEQSGTVLASLAATLDDPLALVPTGLPAGRLDAQVRDSVVAALRDAPLFGGHRACDVAALGAGTGADTSPTLLDALAPTGLGVVDVPPARRAAARSLGMPVLSVPDVVDALPAALAPAQWRALYAALAPVADTDRAAREALDGVLVPLADGTTVRGPRGLVLPSAQTAVDGLLTVPGLRLVHPEAVDPLLRRLGAVDLHDPAVLALPAVEAAVHDVAELLTDRDADQATGDDLGALPGLLALLQAVVGSGRAPDDLPSWWGGLPLPGTDGVWSRARDLVQPGTWAAEHLDLAVLDLDALRTALETAPATALGRPGADGGPVTLDAASAAACGVRTGLAVQTVDLDTGDADDADDLLLGLPPGTEGGAPEVAGWADYDAYLCAVLGRGARLTEVPVLLDLDAVHDDSWGDVVRLAERDPVVRRALVTRVGPVVPSGPTALSYGAWYLRDVVEAPFVVPGEGAVPDADLLAVLPTVPADLEGVHDAPLLSALGAVATVDDLARALASPDPVVWDGFFAALDNPDRPDGGAVPPSVARTVWDALGRAAVDGLALDDLPDVLVAVRAGVSRTVDASTAVVAVDPMWAQLRAVVPAAGRVTGEAVADVLDLPLADPAGVVVQASDDPDEHEVPPVVLALLPGVPAGWLEHDDLVVDGQDVDWWVTADGGAHLRLGAPRATLARALAQAGGRWGDRFLLEALLADPARARDVDLDGAWG